MKVAGAPGFPRQHVPWISRSQPDRASLQTMVRPVHWHQFLMAIHPRWSLGQPGTWATWDQAIKPVSVPCRTLRPGRWGALTPGGQGAMEPSGPWHQQPTAFAARHAFGQVRTGVAKPRSLDSPIALGSRRHGGPPGRAGPGPAELGIKLSRCQGARPHRFHSNLTDRKPMSQGSPCPREAWAQARRAGKLSGSPGSLLLPSFKLSPAPWYPGCFAPMETRFHEEERSLAPWHQYSCFSL